MPARTTQRWLGWWQGPFLSTEVFVTVCARLIGVEQPVQGAARKANRIAIHHDLGDVVAVIEIVSPGNKDSRHSIRAFAEKAAALIKAAADQVIRHAWTQVRKELEEG